MLVEACITSIVITSDMSSRKRQGDAKGKVKGWVQSRPHQLPINTQIGLRQGKSDNMVLLV